MKKSSQHYLVFYNDVSVYLEKMKPQTLKQFFTDETIKNYLTDTQISVGFCLLFAKNIFLKLKPFLTQHMKNLNRQGF